MIYELDGNRPDLPEQGRYWVAPGATLIGKVRLKIDASVWFGAVLRGDNEWIELGERSQIQDNATLHTDPGYPLTIGPDCVIGHNVILHGCTIGANSLVGMGAIMLNGARIGAHCLVGAGALLTEGKTFPDKSLIVGAPARAIRTLDETAIKMIAAGADIYVRRFKQYAKGLKPVG
ncbi:MAG TPA: gamma carbonic anhydrase family protein [Xanthobacteraceae bacterium]|nr:gamma carbonic anhydrase family protein [Xanthobacteraceae bacterium]